ncbi:MULTISPECIES: hypothetical protein [Vibrio]|uniref:hypothetical protein n=1 Tax=Vibrio TaxID=662 RepID=UPI0019D4C45E|nr:hypothetical protein [Vibrio vulnificus]MBN8105550.1 hypothetical protein [Vibrio vulnificus]
MYRLFLKNSERKHHYGQPFEEVGESVRLALEFRDIVPFIMITNEEGHSIFEVENGVIVFPEDEGFLGIPSMGLAKYLPNDTSDYSALIKQRNQANKSEILFRELEALLLAAAARDSVNLNFYGWSVPE